MVVVSSNDIINLKKFSGLIWVYLGSYKGLESAKNILREKNRRFIGKDIEKITDSVRDNFVDYIGKLSCQQSNKVLWYSSPMASKSTSQTTMFHQYVYQKLLEGLSEEESDILIVTDDIELLDNIRKIQPAKIRSLSKHNSYRRKLYERARGYREVLRHILFWFICQFLKNRHLQKFNILIHSWIDERTFTNTPKFVDSYFTDLEDILSERGYRVGRLTSQRLPLRYIYKLQARFSNIVYSFSYLTFVNLLKAISIRFTIELDDDDPGDIKDLNILKVLTENEISKENLSKNYLYYLLLFYSYNDLNTRIANKISIIYTFENQPWEKMLNIAFEKLNRIAYQHSTIPYNWLDYRISPYEKEVPLPKVILTAGKRCSSFLKEYIRNSTIIKEAGALRYPHLFKKEKYVDRMSQMKNIVVTLPITPTIAIPLERQLLNFLRRNPLSDYNIRIKPHPYLPKSAHLKDSFAGYRNCQFVSTDMNILFKDCVLSITSSLTIAFESIFSGIKTLYFVSEEPSFGLDYFIRDYLFIAYEDDFSRKLEEALKDTAYPDVDIDEYFSPANYSVFLEHINV